MVSTTAAVATVIISIYYTPMSFQSFVGYAHAYSAIFGYQNFKSPPSCIWILEDNKKNCWNKHLLSFLNASYLPNTVVFSDFKDHSSYKFWIKWKVTSFWGHLNIPWVDLWKSLYMTCIHDWQTEWLIEWVNMVFNYKQPPPSLQIIGGDRLDQLSVQSKISVAVNYRYRRYKIDMKISIDNR